MVVGVIFMIVLARGNQAEVGIRLRSREEADFACGMAGDGQEKKRAAARTFDIDAESFVMLLVEQGVGFGGSENVTI